MILSPSFVLVALDQNGSCSLYSFSSIVPFFLHRFRCDLLVYVAISGASSANVIVISEENQDAIN